MVLQTMELLGRPVTVHNAALDYYPAPDDIQRCWANDQRSPLFREPVLTGARHQRIVHLIGLDGMVYRWAGDHGVSSLGW